VGFYVIVRGPLGSGKTALARRLTESLGGRYISIDQILDDHQLELWDGDYISEQSFLAANRFAVRRAEAGVRRGAPVIIDGNFYWKSVLADLVTKLPYPHLVLTLKVPFSDCVARDAGRTHPLGLENVRMVFDKVTSFDCGLSLDATGSLEDTTRRALRALEDAGLRPAEPTMR
jgi:tRNA uridine 5-carbamoylmethylation protein Kti12